MKFNKLYLVIGILVAAVVVVLFAANIFCLKCISPENESHQHNLSISEVSGCRNDTVADFEIELYLNGTPLDKIRNWSYYYRNETIEAKVKPNRQITIYTSWTWQVYKRYNRDLNRISIYAEANCGILCKDNSTMCSGDEVILCGEFFGSFDGTLMIVNCTDVWFKWNQTEYIAKTINCSNVQNSGITYNQTVEWVCSEIKKAKVGKYVLRFCYGTDYTPPDMIPIDREFMGICCGEAKCIYKEFSIGQPPYYAIWKFREEI